MKYVILTILIAASLVACKKEDTNNPAVSGSGAINIVIDTPNEPVSFDFGDEIIVSGTITASNEVHGYSVSLINSDNQDSIVYLDEVHSHGSNVQFNNTWTHELIDTSNVLVQVVAYGDHDQTITDTATINIVCNGQ